MAIAFVGCAKDPTTIVISVGADATVPPLLILRTAVVSTVDPTRMTGSDRTSMEERADASDRPGPFVLPLLVPLTVDPGLAGPVTVTVQGLDWDTKVVVAEGSTEAAVMGGHETQATVVLSATGLTGGTDAGADAP